MSSHNPAGLVDVVAKFRRRTALSHELGRHTMLVTRRDIEALVQQCVRLEATVRCLEATVRCLGGGVVLGEEDRVTQDRSPEGGGRKRLSRVKGRGIA